MKRFRVVASIVLLCVSISMQSCYSNRVLMRQELEQHPQGNITTLYTRDSTYNFIDYGRGEVVDDTLVVGRVEPGMRVQVPMREVLSVRLKKFDLLKTGMLIGGLAVGAFIVNLALLMAQLND